MELWIWLSYGLVNIVGAVFILTWFCNTFDTIFIVSRTFTAFEECGMRRWASITLTSLICVIFAPALLFWYILVIVVTVALWVWEHIRWIFFKN